MSVLVVDRTESRYEAVVFAPQVQSILRDFMQRNFGVKDIYRLAELNYAYGKDEQESFKTYVYRMDSHKKNIDQLCCLLRNNVRAAQSIYPTNMREYETRRIYQDTAIANCVQIRGELMQVIEDFHLVDINGFRPSNDAINREIDLIKRWRQRDNKFKSYFKKQGSV